MNFDFVTADPHFDHDAIRRHCGRPYPTVEDMNEAEVSNWNEIVGKKDLVVVGGDFAFKNHGHWLHALNGRKILIRGNHDHMSQEILKNFTEVHDLWTTNNDGRLVTFCHYAMLSWRSSCHGSWHLYGHSHGRIPERPDVLSFDIGVDVWGFRPIPWEVVRAKMSMKESKDFYSGHEDSLATRVESLRTSNLRLYADVTKTSLVPEQSESPDSQGLEKPQNPVDNPT